MSESGSKRPANRLGREISPYLLLHAHNPVDWYPWGEEALERARSEDKPIFLSVGYSTCYWCHVMERESFSDAGVAELMNRRFVNIKVDREERPEIDEIYMAATQIFAQQGGWPNSVFLTPELKPFFAGTYFPPTDMHGRPSFRTVLLSMQAAWDTRRSEVDEQAEEMAGAMQRMLEERGTPSDRVAAPAVAEASLEALAGRFDAQHGGFGGAPKFPSPSNLYLLFESLGGRGAGDDRRDAGVDVATMLATTLEEMARGGIYDQLAGGFHRYATDRAWKVPHFEKMLYDNGFLLELYGLDFARTGDPERARIARETATFLEREMTSLDGGLYSAIDAEVAGREGAYHVWTVEEIVDVLGQEDASFLAPIYGFDEPPFFDREYHVLHLPRSWSDLAQRRRTAPETLHEQVEPLRRSLLEAREKRPRPAVDDKILTDWNGIAITGLAVAGDLLGDESMVRQAERAADFVLEHLVTGTVPRLRHSWRDGEARYDAYLADYVFFVRGLLALHDATAEGRWLEAAVTLTNEQIERLEDPSQGGFFTAGESPDVLFRSKEIFDGAMPAANAVAVLNLLGLAEVHADADRWLDIAERTLRAFATYCERVPEAARMLTVAAHRWHALAGLRVDERFDGVETGLDIAALVGDAARSIVDTTLHVDPPGSARRGFRLELTIRDGWHVYAADELEENDVPVEPTTLEGDGLGTVTWPEAERWGDEGLRVYSGTVEIVGRLDTDDDAPSLVLRYQACDDRRCLAPVSVELEGRAEEPAN